MNSLVLDNGKKMKYNYRVNLSEPREINIMYTIGVDLGGTNIAVGLCDENFKIIDKDSVPTLAKRAPELIVKGMAELTDRIIKRNNLTLSDIEYVGIATPGSVDAERGYAEYTNNLPFVNFPLADIFRSFLPVSRIILENDANAAALGEALAGSAKGAKTAIMITLGTGVGGGIIIDGKIFAGGVNASGAEIGHHVIRSGGRQCTCGRRGCFEAYASATALTAMTSEKIEELSLKGIDSVLEKTAKSAGKVSARTAFDAMKAGCKWGREVVESYIFYLAEGITNMINIFQPEILCIGGGVCNEREYLTVPLTEIIERDQYTRNSKKKTKLVIAELGNDAGLIGAAGLGI